MITGPVFTLGAILMFACMFLAHDDWGVEDRDV